MLLAWQFLKQLLVFEFDSENQQIDMRVVLTQHPKVRHVEPVSLPRP
jgi:hypothetical protein